MLNRFFTILFVFCVLLLTAQPVLSATNAQQSAPPTATTIPADPDDFSVNGHTGWWHPGDNAWYNDHGSRMPHFQDVIDYIGFWVCGYYGCLGDRR